MVGAGLGRHHALAVVVGRSLNVVRVPSAVLPNDVEVRGVDAAQQRRRVQRGAWSVASFDVVDELEFLHLGQLSTLRHGFVHQLLQGDVLGGKLK